MNIIEWKRRCLCLLLVLLIAILGTQLSTAESGLTVGDYIFLDGPTSGFRSVSANDFLNGTAEGIGVQDVTDLPLAGVHVSLYRQSGELVATTTSDAEGHYSFDGLDVGNYYMEFDAYDAADQLAADGLISSADMLEFTDVDWGDDALNSDVVRGFCLERDCTQFGRADFELTDDILSLDTIDAGLMVVGPDATLAVTLSTIEAKHNQTLVYLFIVVVVTLTSIKVIRSQ